MVPVLPAPPSSSSSTAATTTQANYLNKQTEQDLQAIEACKIDISLLDQKCLTLQEQRQDALHKARALKETNNGVIAAIKALKDQERANLSSLESKKVEHEQTVAEMRQTIVDLGFYLRSRDTLAAIPSDRVSQREVQSGTVEVVREDDRECERERERERERGGQGRSQRQGHGQGRSRRNRK